MGAIINPLSTEAAVWVEKKRSASHYTICLPLATRYSFRPLGRGEWIAVVDSLIGRCLELSEVRTVNPIGNTLRLTWVNLALYVPVTRCWWKNRGAIKQRQTIWVRYGQPWGVEEDYGDLGVGVVLLFCSNHLLTSSSLPPSSCSGQRLRHAQRLALYSTLIHICEVFCSAVYKDLKICEMSPSQQKKMILRFHINSTVSCCREDRCCL